MTNLIEFTEQVLAKYPSLKPDIDSLIQLCHDEIEEGGSEANEISLCWTDIDQLVKIHENKILARNL